MRPDIGSLLLCSGDENTRKRIGMVIDQDVYRELHRQVGQGSDCEIEVGAHVAFVQAHLMIVVNPDALRTQIQFAVIVDRKLVQVNAILSPVGQQVHRVR